MERFRTGLFRRIVLLNMMQAIVLSVTGIVDCAFVGQCWGAAGLAGMKLAMPVFSVLYLFGSIFSSGLSVRISQLLASGNRQSANQSLLWVFASAESVSYSHAFDLNNVCVRTGYRKGGASGAAGQEPGL